MYIYDNIPLNS